jgi:hypothetical protein
MTETSEPNAPDDRRWLPLQILVSVPVLSFALEALDCLRLSHRWAGTALASKAIVFGDTIDEVQADFATDGYVDVA